MHKLIVALVAGTFAAIAGAQTPAATGQMKQAPAAAPAAMAPAPAAAPAMAPAMEKSQKHTKTKKMHKKAKSNKSKASDAGAMTQHATSPTNTTAAAGMDKAKMDAAPKKAPSMGTPAAESAMQKASKP
ncbi:MAG: hypothetical protein ABI190_06150 [Casimicrobiaceae bacterium]